MGIFGKAITGAMVYFTVKRIYTHINETTRLRKEAKES